MKEDYVGIMPSDYYYTQIDVHCYYFLIITRIAWPKKNQRYKLAGVLKRYHQMDLQFASHSFSGANLSPE